MQAVADALKRFEAEEIVVVGTGEVDGELLAELRGLGLPVTAPGPAELPATAAGAGARTVRGLTSGRSEGTPWVAFVGANLGCCCSRSSSR